MSRTTLRALSLPGLWLALLMTVLLAGCGGGGGKKMSERDWVLRGYTSAVRWSQFEEAWAFVEPKYREEHPLTDLEMERFRQVQVTNYTVRSQTELPDGSLEQVVEIRLVGRNTQVERMLIDHQHWVFDPTAKRWWLAGGLPDITQHD